MTTPPEQPPVPEPQQAPAAPQPQPQQLPQPLPAGPPTSSNAVVALVLSIATWVICFVPPFSLIPAIIALVFASKADREIRASGGQIGGAGLVTASRIVAWVAIGVTAAILVIGIVVLLVLLIAGALSVPEGMPRQV